MSRYRVAAVALMGGTLLSGCALFKSEVPDQPKELLEAPIPKAWISDSANKDSPLAPQLQSGWVSEFKDPALDKLVDDVWSHNSSLLAAVSRRDAAAAKTAVDKAAGLPSVDLQATVGRQHTINDFQGDSSLLPEDAYISRIKIGPTINWELDVWGRIFNNKNAAIGEVWSAGLDVESAKFSLAAQTAASWFGLIAAEKRVELAREMDDAERLNVKFAEERYRLGLLAAAEWRQTKSEALTAEADLENRQLERVKAARQLELLMGQYPSGAMVAGQQLPMVPPSAEAGVPSELLERRPDVQSAAIRVLASDQRLLAAKKNLLPHFSIQGSAATQAKYRDYLFTDDSFVWSLGGGLLQPLFEGGQLRAAVKAQRALMFESINRYRDKVYGAFREVEDALSTDASLRKQRDIAEQTLKLAQDGRDSAEQRYHNGSIDARTLLAARRAVMQAQLRVLEVHLGQLNNRIALDLALGGAPVAEPTNTDDAAKTASSGNPAAPVTASDSTTPEDASTAAPAQDSAVP